MATQLATAVRPLIQRAWRLAPGLALCVAIAAAAGGLQQLEVRAFGRAWLEALVLAILIGAAVRTAWTPGQAWTEGVEFSGKTLLELAVVLLGATIDARTMAAAGPQLLIGTAALVVLAIAASFGLGRLFGLPRRMAVLIACGNSICGNSAIAAVAPVIGAESEDVSAAIAFTAVLGVAVVLLLPLLGHDLRMGPQGFGVFAGLTVYAVPQVLAATAPMNALAAQAGIVTKLARVLMLGPVVAGLALFGRDRSATSCRPRLAQLVPWFILGFLALLAIRSAGWIPAPGTRLAGAGASALTTLSMAALGLGCDLRALSRAGPRVSAVVALSLLVLGAGALGLLRLLGLA